MKYIKRNEESDSNKSEDPNAYVEYILWNLSYDIFRKSKGVKNPIN